MEQTVAKRRLLQYHMSVQNPEDIKRIERFKNGDTSSFEEIVIAYQDKIYNLCRYMLGNPHDAEDASQEVFLKAYQALAKFEPQAGLYTWLYRIAVNTCVDYKRKPIWQSLFGISEKEEVLLHDRASDRPSPEMLYQSKQTDKALHAGLALLSPKLKAILVLREMEGLSYEEIADTLNVSVGTVKSRIARAREDLKKIIKSTEQNEKYSV